jgi:hypothetical protein
VNIDFQGISKIWAIRAYSFKLLLGKVAQIIFPESTGRTASFSPATISAIAVHRNICRRAALFLIMDRGSGP